MDQEQSSTQNMEQWATKQRLGEHEITGLLLTKGLISRDEVRTRVASTEGAYKAVVDDPYYKSTKQQDTSKQESTTKQ